MSLKLVPFESSDAVSYSPSTVIMALSCIIFEIKPDIGQSRHFFIRLAFDAPLGGRPPSEYCDTVSYGKTRMVWLPEVKKTLRIRITISTEYWRLTNGQTNRRTDRRSDILRRNSPRRT